MQKKYYYIGDCKSSKSMISYIMCNWSDGVVERVTEQVTKEVTAQMIITNVENIMSSLEVSVERACEILKIKLEDYQSARENIVR